MIILTGPVHRSLISAMPQSLLTRQNERLQIPSPPFAWQAVFAIVLATVQLAVADSPPALVLTARSADSLIDNAQRLLETAGVPEREAQLRQVLTFVNNLNGLDHERTLGVLVYLSADHPREPELIVCLPVRSLDDLFASLAPIPNLTLTRDADPDSWVLRGGDKSLFIRMQDGYAFVAQHRERLSAPLPALGELTEPQATDDLAVTLNTAGIPRALVDKALNDLHAQGRRDAERKSSESDAEFGLRSRLQADVVWVIEHALREMDHATIGIRWPRDVGRLELAATVRIPPQTELARAVSAVSADGTQFQSIIAADAPFAAATTWTLSGETRQLAADAVAQLRRNIERRMQQDGSINGPAAQPIRQILDVMTATVDGGQVDGGVVFQGDKPGAMLLLAGTRIANAADMASALETLLPLIAESEAVADLELNAVEAGGVSLHRVTLQEIRKQDEWLYGPDVGLYLGAGRDAVWLALGGFDREARLQELLAREPVAARTAPPLLQLDARLSPWLEAGVAVEGKRPHWLGIASAALAGGRDQVHVEVIAAEDGLHLNATLDEAYIRVLTAVWRAKHQPADAAAPRKFAAPKRP